MITTPTGYTYPVSESRGRCSALLCAPGLAQPCGVTAPAYTVDLTRLRRGLITECHCAQDGGVERSLAQLRADWQACAPPRVGDGEAVQVAGCLSLTSREAYVVVRPEHGIWLAWLGIGSHLIAVPNPDGGRRDREGKLATYRRRDGSRGVRGAKSFALREDALQEAHRAWRANLDATIARITEARGGTLAWGVPVEPRTEPIVLMLGEHGSAWDAIQRGEV